MDILPESLSQESLKLVQQQQQQQQQQQFYYYLYKKIYVCPANSQKASHGGANRYKNNFNKNKLSRSRAGARYTKSIANLELRHKEHNNDPYFLHNNTIDFTQ